MKLNEPEITLDKVDSGAYHRFYSDFYSIIDGFDKDGSPCLPILSQPKVAGGSFAGVKQSVIVLDAAASSKIDS